MIIDDVHRGIQKNKKRKRVGRGPGSGHGKTSGRGHNGQGSRAGNSAHVTFQGGAMPLIRRIPKRGFNNKWAKEVAVVNLGTINDAFEDGAEVTLELLMSRNIAKGRFDELKILGEGELTKKIKLHAHRFSKSAAEKISKAGGEMVLIPVRTPVAVKQRLKKAEKAKAARAAKA